MSFLLLWSLQFVERTPDTRKRDSETRLPENTGQDTWSGHSPTQLGKSVRSEVEGISDVTWLSCTNCTP